MSSSALSKVLLPGFLLAGFAVSGNAADAVIVGELIDAETLLGVPGEIALTSNEKGNLVSRHAQSDAAGRVGQGETELVSLYLKQGKLLSGRVSDAQGKPVARAQVSVHYARDRAEDAPLAATYQWVSGEVLTDQQGAYAIRDVHPEKGFVVEAAHAGFLTALSAPTTMGAAAGLSVDLSLEEGLSVSGTVQDAAGRPVAGAKVGLLGPLPREARRFVAIELLKESRAFTASDEQGAFRFEHMRPGEKELLVAHPSYGKALQRFELPKGGLDAPIRITLSP